MQIYNRYFLHFHFKRKCIEQRFFLSWRHVRTFCIIRRESISLSSLSWLYTISSASPIVSFILPIDFANASSSSPAPLCPNKAARFDSCCFKSDYEGMLVYFAHLNAQNVRSVV